MRSMKRGKFSVTYERVNDREAMQGGTTRHGIVEGGLSLREAMQVASREIASASERRGAYPSDSDTSQSRWVSFEYFEYETGDSLTVSVHFPSQSTPATRKRLTAALIYSL